MSVNREEANEEWSVQSIEMTMDGTKNRILCCPVSMKSLYNP